MIVGTAEVLVVPITKGFEKELKDSTAPGFTSFRKDAEAAGENAGAGMRRGVAKESEKLASDTEKAGAKAGEGLHKGIAGGLSGLASAIGAVGVPVGGLSTNLEKAGRAAESTGSHSSGLAGKLETLGSASLKVGAVLSGAVAVAAVDVGEKMQSAETKIAGAAGTSVKAAQQIGSAFETTAGKSEFSAVQMAQAFAGVAGQLKSTEGHALSAKEALSVMSASSDLAAAKQIDLGTATSTLAKVMQAFKLPADQAGHATDVLFQASNATGQSVDGLGNQLAKVKSKLGDTGGSIGDLSALLVDMTNQGITGRASMGALNASMNTLQKTADAVTVAQQAQQAAFAQMPPSLQTLAKGYEDGSISAKDFHKETGKLAPDQAALVASFTKATSAIQSAQVKYKELGLSVFDAHGKFVGMGQIIDQLHPKFAQMTQAQQLATASTLFGAGAARQMTAIIDAGPAAYDKASASVNKHGAAQAAAAQQAKTLHGEEATLKAEMSDLAAKVGAVLIPILTKMIGAFVSATTFVTSHKAALIALGTVVAGVLGPAIAVFTVNKMAAFGRSFTEASGHVKSFASDVEGVVKRVIKAFGEQDAAATKMSGATKTETGKAGTAAKGLATDSEGAATRVETANAGAGGSFGEVTDGAVKEEAPLGAAEAGLAGEVGTADSAIEAENATAGGSFAAITSGARGAMTALAPFLGALGAAGALTVGGAAVSHAINPSYNASKAADQQIPGKVNAPGTNAGSGANIGGVHIGGPGGAALHAIGIGAAGGYITKPTLMIAGEAGPEMLIPMNDLAAIAAQGTPIPALNLAPAGATGAKGGAGPGAGAKQDLGALGTSTGASADLLAAKSALMVKSLTGVVSLGTTPMKAGAQRDLAGLQSSTGTTRDVVDQKSVLMVGSMKNLVSLGTTPMQAATKRDLTALATHTTATRDVVDQKSVLMVKSMTGVVTTGTTPMRAGTQRDLAALATNTATSFGAALHSTQTATSAMSSAVSTQSAQAMSAGSKNFEGLGQNVAGYMGATSTAVGKGLSNITSQLNSALKAYGAGAVSLSAVAPASAASLAGLVTGAGVPGHFSGAKVTQPMYRVGEEAPRFQEYVLTENPAHRPKNLGLWAQAGRALKVPGFAAGGAPSGYTDPISGFTIGRTDMGVDASARPGSPIVAPGPSQMVGYQANWFQGQPEMVFELTGGPGKGRFWYVAEQITPVAHMGQSVPQGGVVATFAPHGTGIEIGWAANAAGTTLAQATTGYHEGQVTPAGQSFLSLIGGGSPGATGLAAPWTNLKAPAWSGPGGALGQLGKGALKKALDAANAKGQKVAAAASAIGGGSVAPIGNEKQIVMAAAQRYGVPANILGGVFGMETDFGHNVATSSAGAVGDFQFIPSTAASFNYPLTNTPSAAQFAQQASSAAQYLASLDASHHGDWNAALEAYSGGGYGVAQVLAKGAIGGYAKGGIPFAGAFGSGGTVTASSPTLAMFGDRGTETAHFVPGYAAGGAFDPVQHAKDLAALNAEIKKETAAAAAEISKLKATLAPTSETTYTVGKKGVVTGHVHHTPPSAEAKASVAEQIAAIKAALAVQIAQQKGALAVQTAQQKAELKAQSTDLKAGTGQLNKLLSAIHSGGVKALESSLWNAHLAGLSKIERDLDHDHSAALARLSKELVAVHQQAMKDLVKAQAAAGKVAAEKATTALLTKEATDLTRTATDAAQGIADQTKIALDTQTEAGLTGAALTAAQAQVALDQVAAQGNRAISGAQAGVDAAAGGSALAQAQAAYALAQAQAAATISSAQATSALDKANAAASAASAAPSSSATTNAPQQFNFQIFGNGTLTASELFSEVGWAIRTGALPVAPPAPAHV